MLLFALSIHPWVNHALTFLFSVCAIVGMVTIIFGAMSLYRSGEEAIREVATCRQGDDDDDAAEARDDVGYLSSPFARRYEAYGPGPGVGETGPSLGPTDPTEPPDPPHDPHESCVGRVRFFFDVASDPDYMLACRCNRAFTKTLPDLILSLRLVVRSEGLLYLGPEIDSVEPDGPDRLRVLAGPWRLPFGRKFDAITLVQKDAHSGDWYCLATREIAVDWRGYGPRSPHLEMAIERRPVVA